MVGRRGAIFRANFAKYFSNFSGHLSTRESDLGEKKLRLAMQDLRRRIRKTPNNVPKLTHAQRSNDRHARDFSRRILNFIRKTKRPVLSKDLMIAKRRASPILDRLVPDRNSNWVPMLRRREEPTHPPSLSLTNFSFLDDPNGTLKALKQIGLLEREVTSAYLHFDDKHCLDAGSFLVLAEIWPQMARVFKGGRMPKPIQKVLNATGVGRNNKMKLPAAANELDRSRQGEDQDVWAFQLQRRRAALSSKSTQMHLVPQTSEVAANRFCDALNEWLSVPEIDLELTTLGKSQIANIIGELLCNAERHSQPNSDDGDWATSGFMVKRVEEGEPIFRCFLAFLSVGRSFAESFQEAAADIRATLEGYATKHRNHGVSADSLATLFALQDSITCDPEARQMRTGGTGLMEVLDLVNVLALANHADRQPRVSIVSGKSCVQLRQPYLQGVRVKGPEGPRVQWCNEQNDKDWPPDRTAVYDLDEHFAGTIISVEFTLDPKYFDGDTELEDDDDD